MSENAFRLELDRNSRSFRYYRNAVERHWDPTAIDISADLSGVVDMHPKSFDVFRGTVAKFGAGERAVTEELAPLATVLEDPADQAYLTTQLYEEARHLEFFDRYWQEVINEAERERGVERTDPTADRWFTDAYDELLDRTETAMERLLVDDTPENRAEAYCHYHLTIEGILAQTAYYGLHQSYSPAEPGLPTLPGFTEGIGQIRSDEGRHVGFGMSKLEALVEEGVDPQLLHETVNELLPLVNRTTTHGMSDSQREDTPGPSPDELRTYAAEKHLERMDQIVDQSRDIPGVDALVRIEAP